MIAGNLNPSSDWEVEWKVWREMLETATVDSGRRYTLEKSRQVREVRQEVWWAN